MPFIEKDWRNADSSIGGGDVSTPLSAAAIEDLERRLAAYAGERVDSLALDVKESGATGDGSTDDTAAIQATIDAAVARGGATVFFPAGEYNINTNREGAGGLWWGLDICGDNVTLKGEPGAKLISTTANAHADFAQAMFVVNGGGKPTGTSLDWPTHEYLDSPTFAMDPAIKSETTVTLTIPANAANFSSGDWCYIRTGNMSSPGALMCPDAEINQVTFADSSAGVIYLRWPLGKDYEQEYFITGTNGYTSTSVTANAAVFGIANITDRTLENIAFENLGMYMPGDVAGMQGQGQVVGFRIENCEILSGVPTSMNNLREVHWHKNRIHNGSAPTVTWPAIYFFAVATGSSDVWITDNTCSSIGQGFMHAHEGCANVIIRDNIVTNTPTADVNNSSVSVRGRAYDVRVEDNTFVNGTAGACIFVSDDCTGGGVIRGNRCIGYNFVYDVLCQAPNWIVENNGNSDYGAMTLQASTGVSYNGAMCVSGWVGDNQQNTPLGTIPAYSFIHTVRLYVLEAFNSSGTDLLSVGYDASPAVIATNTDVSTAGLKTPTVSAGYYAGPIDVEAYYTAGGTAATTGKAIVVVEYTRVPPSNAVD